MIHHTAEVSPTATVGTRTQIWNEAQIREDARIGSDCIIGKGVYIDRAVTIGDKVKIENRASIFLGSTIESCVFIGPHVCLTNDRFPRATTVAGELKGPGDWEPKGVVVKRGASIGAGSVVLPGVLIGEFAMVGAGSVVTSDVPSHALVVGNPARVVGTVCACGGKVITADAAEGSTMTCSICGGPAAELEGSVHQL